MKILELMRGGTLLVLEVNGEHVVVQSSLSSPPGSPLEASLDGSTLRIKMRSCQRTDPDAAGRTFRIEGLPETHYALSARAWRETDPPPADRGRPVAGYASRVEVPLRTDAEAVHDLGVMTLKPSE